MERWTVNVGRPAALNQWSQTGCHARVLRVGDGLVHARPESVAIGSDFVRRDDRLLTRADRVSVDEREMCGVEEVVGEQTGTRRRQYDIQPHRVKGGVGRLRQVDDVRERFLGREPYQPVAFDGTPRGGRPGLLGCGHVRPERGYGRAFPGCDETPAVIAADKLGTVHPAGRKRRQAMRAPVGEGNHVVIEPGDRPGFTEKADRHRFVADVR